MDINRDHKRPATENDLGALNAIYNHCVRKSHVTFDVEPTGIEWRRRWFEEHADGRHRIFVAILEAEECPAKECPPLRIASSSSCRRANEIASEMSCGVAHDTMPAGATS
jgi:L-amino acid N-acyltransferase YncA